MKISDAQKLAEKIPIERWIEHGKSNIVYYWTTVNCSVKRLPGLHYGIRNHSQAYWFYESAIAHGTCTWEAYFSGDKGVQYPGSQIEMWMRGIQVPPRTSITLQDIEFLLGH